MTNNKTLVKQLTADTESIFGRIKNKIDPRTKSAIITKLGITTHLASVKKLNNELKDLEKAVQTNRLTIFPPSIKSINRKPKIIRVLAQPVLKKYFVSGDVEIQTNYTYETKKRGVQKSKDYIEIKPEAKVIEAFNEKEAKQKFIEDVNLEVPTAYKGETSAEFMVKKINDILNINIKPYDIFEDENESNSFMKSAKQVIYDFIPNDEKFNKNNGFCVSDVFVSLYKNKIKSLTLDKFIDMCYDVRGEAPHSPFRKSLLDVGIDSESDDDYDININKWSLKDGVTPNMLLKICEKLDISHYAFDVTRKCFLKYVSKSRHFEPLVYYCVNNHMYWIADKEASLSLIRNSQDIQTKFKSICLTDENVDKVNIYNLDIKENIPVSDFINIKDSTIIYTKNNLNSELDEIIKTYNYNLHPSAAAATPPSASRNVLCVCNVV